MKQKDTSRPPLTKNQKAVLTKIRNLTAELGRCPSFREIAKEYGCHVNAISCFVETLESKGYVAKTNGVKRSIRAI